ncbi:lithostathine-1-beta-like [Corythoichthys intestinalis]|uniref:lithostathine-1-beta-like n=1 Tax=Corythoichthys intestinalis TaxID=161448 RepID=UPI0025A606F7|nr:lithostathine-1-beta-like [Corythoichthys intestinalis]
MLADAESVCNILGANLVSIHSAVENAFVHELFEEGRSTTDTALWIGLHDVFTDDEFYWTDGTEFDFSGFDTGDSEPGSTADGTCVSMAQDDTLWDTEMCTEERPYICITEVLTHSH